MKKTPGAVTPLETGASGRARSPEALDVFAELFGEERAKAVAEKETPLDRDFNTYMINNIGLGPWGRRVLSLPELSIATLSLLAAQGKLGQFESHLRLALNVSKVSPEKIRELLLHLVMYCGMPVGPDLFGIARRVFRELGIDVSKLD
jgi:alkylhydroperoxidase/carboxymuconolactone decarboxylase family protein YurZ